jgi:uncharacterized protein (TIGR02284 family)
MEEHRGQFARRQPEKDRTSWIRTSECRQATDACGAFSFGVCHRRISGTCARREVTVRVAEIVEASMSNDERVASQLAKTLENGRAGFEQAAERVASAGRVDVAARFREFSAERQTMAVELESLAAAYGDDVDARSTVPGVLHRGWMALKDALTGDDIAAVIRSAEQGEDHALEEYRDALADDISPEFKTILERQKAAVESAHEYVRSLESTLS